GGSLLRLDLLTGLLQDVSRLAPGQHAVFQGPVPVRLEVGVLLDRRLRPLEQGSADGVEIELLPEWPGSEANDRHQAKDRTNHLGPETHGNSLHERGGSRSGGARAPQRFHQDQAWHRKLIWDRATQKQTTEMITAAGVIQGKILAFNASVRSRTSVT